MARPYIFGLQDMLFKCNEPIHDFYHVESQHECLLDGEHHLNVDWIVRYGPALGLLQLQAYHFRITFSFHPDVFWMTFWPSGSDAPHQYSFTESDGRKCPPAGDKTRGDISTCLDIERRVK
jgi:hypothetical protein